MLSERYSEEYIFELLKLNRCKELFPRAENRMFWEGLDDVPKNEIVKEAENFLNYNWEVLLAERYADYLINGDRKNYEEVYFRKRYVLRILVLAECIEMKGRFLKQIINGVWCICEESSWVVPAHNDNKPTGYVADCLPDITKELIVDLFAGETSATLALTYYLLRDSIEEFSRVVGKRVLYEIKKRIFGSYMSCDEFWWMGLVESKSHVVNNWNPWINSIILFQ